MRPEKNTKQIFTFTNLEETGFLQKLSLHVQLAHRMLLAFGRDRLELAVG